MNIFEPAVAEANDDALINALIYKLCQKYGRQFVSMKYQDFKDKGNDFRLPDRLCSVGAEGYYAQLAQHITLALSARYVDSRVIVHLKEVDVEGEIAPMLYFAVNVDNEALGDLLNFRVELHELEADFDTVDILRLVELRKEVNRETPIYVLSHEKILELTGLSVAETYTIDSVSIAALAAGWGDTEQYGQSLLLIK